MQIVMINAIKFGYCRLYNKNIEYGLHFTNEVTDALDEIELRNCSYSSQYFNY